MFKRNKGFTLIELLVVIAIIGVLSSVVLASLNSARQKSRDAKRISDISQIQLALELYFDTNGEYPVALADLVSDFIPAEPIGPLGAATDSYLYQAYTDASVIPPTGTYTCDQVAETCLFYHLGADLEDTHSVLAGDADLAGNYVVGSDSDNNGCGTTGTAGRYCYDVTP
jgi:prepilin-type N-terminal cleavage/methylation domain-containing protein